MFNSFNSVFLFLGLFFMCLQGVQAQQLPQGFVYLDKEIPDIVYEVRYAGENNFMGKPVRGYEKSRAILSAPAAAALAKVQKELISKDYMLKLFDAYRPQKAVNHFMEWARDKNDTLRKSDFYPDVAKKDLFELGYISTRSGHSRGSTVDITLVNVEDCSEVDMGGSYDYFGEISNHYSNQITPQQKKNRELLRLIMRKYGFRSYSKEWWHYTYDAEPFPDTYFDFPVN